MGGANMSLTRRMRLLEIADKTLSATARASTPDECTSESNLAKTM
jgi:hypothetical protein